MARRPTTRSRASTVETVAAPIAVEPQPIRPERRWIALAVVALLGVHLGLAVRSLVTENPTVDEVLHLPSGLSYWQTGTFRLYHHNPPLVKLIAALPLLVAKPVINYQSSYWTQDPPNKAAIGHEFQRENARDYFEVFTRARLLMPLFSILGGLVVFAWSSRLYGRFGGLVSLTLWAFCPNILAHTRLITTDMGATSLGVLATFLFWRFLKGPSWRLAGLAGITLGLAQLSKFSMIVLYMLWPLLAAVRLAIDAEARRSLWRVVGYGAVIVGLSVVVIDAGYAFEGVGIPLGRYEFVSQTLTKPAPQGLRRPTSPDPLLNSVYRYRDNRFRQTWLGLLPMPLPKHYLLGFDDQKLEAEGVPAKFLTDRPLGLIGEKVIGYPVYLDGELRQTSWWYYYLLTLVYKVPEGTWLVVLTSLVLLLFSRRSCAEGFDEFAVLIVPAFVLFVMSVLTNINLGLRYVLPIFPYVFIAAGKVARWAEGFDLKKKGVAAWTWIGLGLVLTMASTVSIHPHYLAYFNTVSGGPDRGAEHLIDSNIDWGQDLINLRRWLARNAPGEAVGLAYFGQVNPRIFQERGEGFEWFLPPPAPRTMPLLPPRYRAHPESLTLRAGLYAVSASLVKGLPWRVYDSPLPGLESVTGWAPYKTEENAFGYFRGLTPIANVGHSIWIYRVNAAEAARLAPIWSGEQPTR